MAAVACESVLQLPAVEALNKPPVAPVADGGPQRHALPSLQVHLPGGQPAELCLGLAVGDAWSGKLGSSPPHFQ